METKPNSADIVRRQTGEVTEYRLQYPVKLKDGTLLEVLHLRRPKNREMRNIELSGRLTMGPIMDMVGVMCALTPDEVDEIDGADVMEIMGVVAPFLAGGTGETPPA